MRKELELIEQIERYINNQLSAEEKAAFEQQLAAEPALREEVLLQQEIMSGVDRAVLKQHIQRAKLKFRARRNFTRWGLGGLIVAIAVIFLINYKTGDVANRENINSTEQNVVDTANQTTPGKYIPTQIFWIDGSKDTVIETKAGIVVAVPANGFIDESGNNVTGRLALQIKEALDPATIMRAGLSTRADGQLLETGGMFFIDAGKNDKRFKVNPNNPLHVEIPTKEVKQGMQLYTGRRMPDSTINWENPASLEHDLAAVDILQLNFYPPNYLQSLKKWGYDDENKTFTDSLYYSFAELFVNRAAPANTAPVHEMSAKDSSMNYPDTIVADNAGAAFYNSCAINPAKIKTIWSTSFQNTIISTREFEQRLSVLHMAGKEDLLDLYVNNLDKNLYEIDSMVAARLTGGYTKEQFMAFAARRDGKLKNNSPLLKKLSAYYLSKSKAYTEAIAKTQREFWNKQASLDNIAAQQRIKHDTDSATRVYNNFVEEFTINVKEAYRQLGYDTSLPPRLPNGNIYRAAISATGWYNVDRAVYESTQKRSTLVFNDAQTGKTAVIKYESVSIEIIDAEKYDRLYVYLLPRELNSFMRLNNVNGVFREKLDELIYYKMLCIGYKGTQPFMFYYPGKMQEGQYAPIPLTAVAEADLNNKLNEYGSVSQSNDLKKELEYFMSESIDQKRRQHNIKLQELRSKVSKLIFPCSDGEGSGIQME